MSRRGKKLTSLQYAKMNLMGFISIKTVCWWGCWASNVTGVCQATGNTGTP
ncbi:hypothetical protein FQN60_010621 [Etheostoma spectabile]|uniref:Uncharacterized protein n=1 Tax=Etheostoma spectabile TaxID=54343 RepID=A0A5J5CF01_9PERO|nr:hypothetical protein FQN60_010621 [Etheostoma spectabile]